MQGTSLFGHNLKQCQDDAEDKKKAVIDALKGVRQTSEEDFDTSKESSMLKGDLAKKSYKVALVLEEKYKDKLTHAGGVDAVLEDLEKFIAEQLLGDVEYLYSKNKRQCTNPDDFVLNSEGTVQQNIGNLNDKGRYKAALRSLKDELSVSIGLSRSNSAVGFGTVFHENSEKTFTAKHIDGTFFEARELLAYMWLAAKDPQMSLLPEDIQQNGIDGCIHAEKMSLVNVLSEIQRAHNDGVYSPFDRIKDNPSCGPGSYGRLMLSAPIYNQTTKLQNSQKSFQPPLQADLDNQMIALIVEDFESLEIDQQFQLVNNFYGCHLYGLQSPEEVKGYTVEQFASELNEKNRLDFDQVWQRMIERNINLQILFNQKDLPGWDKVYQAQKDHIQSLWQVNLEKLYNGALHPSKFIQPITRKMMNRILSDPKKNEVFTQLELDAEDFLDELNNVIESLEDIEAKIIELNKQPKDFDAFEKQYDALNKLTQEYKRQLKKKNELIEQIELHGKQLAAEKSLTSLVFVNHNMEHREIKRLVNTRFPNKLNTNFGLNKTSSSSKATKNKGKEKEEEELTEDLSVEIKPKALPAHLIGIFNVKLKNYQDNWFPEWGEPTSQNIEKKLISFFQARVNGFDEGHRVWINEQCQLKLMNTKEQIEEPGAMEKAMFDRYKKNFETIDDLWDEGEFGAKSQNTIVEQTLNKLSKIGHLKINDGHKNWFRNEHLNQTQKVGEPHVGPLTKKKRESEFSKEEAEAFVALMQDLHVTQSLVGQVSRMFSFFGDSLSEVERLKKAQALAQELGDEQIDRHLSDLVDQYRQVHMFYANRLYHQAQIEMNDHQIQQSQHTIQKAEQVLNEIEKLGAPFEFEFNLEVDEATVFLDYFEHMPLTAGWHIENLQKFENLEGEIGLNIGQFHHQWHEKKVERINENFSVFINDSDKQDNLVHLVNEINTQQKEYFQALAQPVYTEQEILDHLAELQQAKDNLEEELQSQMSDFIEEMDFEFELHTDDRTHIQHLFFDSELQSDTLKRIQDPFQDGFLMMIDASASLTQAQALMASHQSRQKNIVSQMKSELIENLSVYNEYLAKLITKQIKYKSALPKDTIEKQQLMAIKMAQNQTRGLIDTLKGMDNLSAYEINKIIQSEKNIQSSLEAELNRVGKVSKKTKFKSKLKKFTNRMMSSIQVNKKFSFISPLSKSDIKKLSKSKYKVKSPGARDPEVLAFSFKLDEMAHKKYNRFYTQREMRLAEHYMNHHLNSKALRLPRSVELENILNEGAFAKISKVGRDHIEIRISTLDKQKSIEVNIDPQDFEQFIRKSKQQKKRRSKRK